MADGSSYAGMTSMLVIQGANISLLAKVLQQQKVEGRAATQLIEGSASAPSKGAPEPGKGQLVDVVA